MPVYGMQALEGIYHQLRQVITHVIDQGHAHPQMDIPATRPPGVSGKSKPQNSALSPMPTNVGLDMQFHISQHLEEEHHIPPGFDRIVGLRLDDKILPVIVLSKEMLQTLRWVGPMNLRTSRIMHHLATEIDALVQQDTRLYEEASAYQAKKQVLILEAEQGKSHQADSNVDDRMEALDKQFQSLEEQRQKWGKLLDEAKETRQAEAVLHGIRCFRAGEGLEDVLRKSGLLGIDYQTYLEDRQEFFPRLSSFYEEHNGSNRVREVPEEVQALAAEYEECQHQLALVQANYDDRVQTARYRIARWKELPLRGEDRPSRPEVDKELLREDIEKSRRLNEAEHALANVRARLRQHIALSDVDSQMIPEHQPGDTALNYVGNVREAKGKIVLRNWLDNLEPSSPAGATLRHESERGTEFASLDRLKSVGFGDSCSQQEQREFEQLRRRAWTRLQVKQFRPSIA